MAEKVLGSLSKGMVFILSAPAGTGKTTLARMLTDEFPCIAQSVSCTTRAKRPGEISGVDYHFMKESEFQEGVAEGKFLEHAEVFGKSYGTSKAHVEEEIEKGHHVVLVIDTQGALQLKEAQFDAVYIFVRPPNLAELRTRLFKRDTENSERIDERLSWAEKEIGAAQQYDYQIVNDNLHHAYDILRSIFIAEEHKKERYVYRQFNH